MKRIVNWLITTALVLILSGATALVTGCAGHKGAAYKTLRAVGETVDTAMVAYADAVIAGAVDEKAQERIRTLHAQYRAAFGEAVKAARFNYESSAPAEVAALAAQLATTIGSLVQPATR